LTLSLLEKQPYPGYPADYLLARLGGRLAAPTIGRQAGENEPSTPATAEGTGWTDLQKEVRWLHRQMNSDLRLDIEPVLTMFEIHTLVFCLRYLDRGDPARIRELLRFSLMRREIKACLRRATGREMAVTGIVGILSEMDERFRGLEKIWREEGLGRFEAAMRGAIHDYFLRKRPTPPVGRFLTSLIDLRNLLSLYKNLHWGVGAPPPFTAGGSIPPGKLRKIHLHGDKAAIAAELGEGRAESAVDTLFFRSLTRELRRQGREMSPACRVLDYLWRRHLEARNLRLFTLGRELPAELLETELVR